MVRKLCLPREPVEILVVGDPNLLSKWHEVAKAAGFLVHRGRFVSPTSTVDVRRSTTALGIGRGGVVLQVEVVGAAPFWQPICVEERALFINTKDNLEASKVMEAKKLVIDFVAAFRSDAVTPLLLVKSSDGKPVWIELSRG